MYEVRVQNPYTALLAYRWFYATYLEVLDGKDEHRAHARQHDGYMRVGERQLNEELVAYYYVSAVDECDDDADEDFFQLDYVVELSDNPHIECVIRVHDHLQSFTVAPDEVERRLDAFCARVFTVCACHRLAKERLQGLCTECYVYNFTRTDDRCGICLEHTGRWVQLSCRHVVHERCWRKLPGDKCPLCRSLIDPTQCVWKFPFTLKKEYGQHG